MPLSHTDTPSWEHHSEDAKLFRNCKHLPPATPAMSHPLRKFPPSVTPGDIDHVPHPYHFEQADLTVLCFTVPHGCCIFHKSEARASTRKHYDSLYSCTLFTTAVWTGARDTSEVCLCRQNHRVCDLLTRHNALESHPNFRVYQQLVPFNCWLASMIHNMDVALFA